MSSVREKTCPDTQSIGKHDMTSVDRWVASCRDQTAPARQDGGWMRVPQHSSSASPLRPAVDCHAMPCLALSCLACTTRIASRGSTMLAVHRRLPRGRLPYEAAFQRPPARWAGNLATRRSPFSSSRCSLLAYLLASSLLLPTSRSSQELAEAKQALLPRPRSALTVAAGLANACTGDGERRQKERIGATNESRGMTKEVMSWRNADWLAAKEGGAAHRRRNRKRDHIELVSSGR